jgi:hypothetical protein
MSPNRTTPPDVMAFGDGQASWLGRRVYPEHANSIQLVIVGATQAC